MALSAHKIHGPKGIGALFVRKGVRLKPLLQGGGQERRLRSSTENVPGLELDTHGFAVLTGSACSSGHAHQPSHVLVAMGFDQFRARGSLRVTLGRFNTEEEVEMFLRKLPEVVSRMRKMSPQREAKVARG